MSILTLSGWAQPADALSVLIPGAAAFDFSAYGSADSAIDALASYRDAETVIGWSTGGWLAAQAIAQGVIAPRMLVLVAAPFQFVNDGVFKDGMPEFTFRQFRENYKADPARTSGRFHGLVAKGDADMRAIMERLSHHSDVGDVERWLPWLDALAARPLHDIRLTTPHITLLHGENDAIVPVAQTAQWKQRHPQMQVEIWQNTCHAPHLHDTERFLSKLKADHAG